MKLPFLKATAMVAVTAGQYWAAVFGITFLIRCEFTPTLPGGYPTCWVIGGAIAGVPFAKRMAERAGFAEGFNTYNPALKRPEDEEGKS